MQDDDGRLGDLLLGFEMGRAGSGFGLPPTPRGTTTAHFDAGTSFRLRSGILGEGIVRIETVQWRVLREYRIGVASRWSRRYVRVRLPEALLWEGETVPLWRPRMEPQNRWQ
jgi:hypothetical protein